MSKGVSGVFLTLSSVVASGGVEDVGLGARWGDGGGGAVVGVGLAGVAGLGPGWAGGCRLMGGLCEHARLERLSKELDRRCGPGTIDRIAAGDWESNRPGSRTTGSCVAS